MGAAVRYIMPQLLAVVGEDLRVIEEPASRPQGTGTASRGGPERKGIPGAGSPDSPCRQVKGTEDEDYQQPRSEICIPRETALTSVTGNSKARIAPGLRRVD